MRPQFEDTWTGTNGDAWSPGKWSRANKNVTHNNTGTIDIQSNKGRMLTGVAAASQVVAIANMQAVRDAELYFEATYTSGAPELDITLRSDWTFDEAFQAPDNGVQLALILTGGSATQSIFRLRSGVATSLTSVAATFTSTHTYGIRFRVVGQAYYAKWWDLTGAEPATWNLTTTDGISTPGVLTIDCESTTAAAAEIDVDNLQLVNLSDTLVVRTLSAPDGNWLRQLRGPANQSTGASVASDATVTATGLAGQHLNIVQYLAELRTPGLPLLGHHTNSGSGATLASDGTATATGQAGTRLGISQYLALLQRRSNEAILNRTNSAAGATVASDGSITGSGLPGARLSITQSLALLQRRTNEAILNRTNSSTGATVASDATTIATGQSGARQNVAQFLARLRDPGLPLVGYHQNNQTGAALASDATVTATGAANPRLNLAAYLAQLQHEFPQALRPAHTSSTGATVASDATVTASGLAGPVQTVAQYLARLRHQPLEALLAPSAPVAATGSTGGTLASDATLTATGVVTPRFGIVAYLARLQRRQVNESILGPKNIAASSTLASDTTIAATGQATPRLNVVMYLTRLGRDDLLRLRGVPSVQPVVVVGVPSGLPGLVSPSQLSGLVSPQTTTPAHAGVSAPTQTVGGVNPSQRTGQV